MTEAERYELLKQLAYADQTGKRVEAAKIAETLRAAASEEYAGGGLTGFTRSVIGQGAGLGFGDEAEAALRTGFGMTGDYTETRDRIRAEQEAWAERNPATDFGAQMLGGLATGGIGAAKAAGMAGARRLGAYALQGAGMGAVAGAGGAREAEDMLGDAATGAALGGLTGAGMGWGMDRITRALKGGGQERRLLERALQEQGMTPAQVAAEIRRLGGEATAMTTGPAMRTIGADIAESPGAGRQELQQFLIGREQRKPQRLMDAVQDVTGIREDAFAAKDRLAGRLRAEGDANYTAAREVPIRPDAHMLRVLDEEPRLVNEVMTTLNQRRRTSGLPRYEDPPVDRLEFWDELQRHYDSGSHPMVPGARPTPAQQANAGTRRELLANEAGTGLDQQNPAFLEARTNYAQNATALDAVEHGTKLMNLPLSHFSRAMQDMRPETREAMAIGLFDAISNKIAASPETANIAYNIVKSMAAKEKFRQLLPDGRGDQLIRRLEADALTSLDYQAAMTGSKTARMLAGAEEVNGDNLGSLISALLTDISSVPARAAGMVGKTISGRANKLGPQARERLSALMQQMDPDMAQQAMDDILNGTRSLEAWEAFARRMPGAAAQQPIGWSQ